MDWVDVQVLDDTGNWRTYERTPNTPLVFQQAMKNLQRQFPNSRVRAIDQNGRLVDMLWSAFRAVHTEPVQGTDVFDVSSSTQRRSHTVNWWGVWL